MVSVVHAVGHAVGGRYALQHGIAHAILLPRASARCLPAIGERQYDLLAALGGRAGGATPDEAGEESVRLLAALVGGLPIPRRLRDAGVPESDLPTLAALVRASRCCEPLPVELGEPDLLELLVDAW